VRPGVHEDAQPLRLGYASHALKLQGGQAQVVLVLPGGWQTSRQSAYSMATRCVDELHVFVDAQTQQAGPYRERDPVQALGARWTRDAVKQPAGAQLDRQPELAGSPDRSNVDDHVVVAPRPPYEQAVASPARELPNEREVPDGLGIDP
jgi:hypothetical protein